MRLKDQVAIVTGGGGGLGEGISLCLAKEGADLVVSDILVKQAKEVAKKVEETGRRSLVVKTDVRMSKQCQLLMETALSKMGRIDILVCCAGVGGFDFWDHSGQPPIIENISEKAWNFTIDVNLKGVFLCNRAIAPYFKRQKRGKIINISSTAGRKGVDWIAHYSASKAGVIVLTQAVALQLAPYGVNVNTVCPGPVRTSMYDKGLKVLGESHPRFKGMHPEEIFDALVKTRVPLQRPQTPDAIGQAVAFLASPQADEITGQAINVDGGAIFC